MKTKLREKKCKILPFRGKTMLLMDDYCYFLACIQVAFPYFYEWKCKNECLKMSLKMHILTVSLQVKQAVLFSEVYKGYRLHFILIY